MPTFSKLLRPISLAILSTLVAQGLTPAETPGFNRDIRRILSDKCFHCHGPDTNHREADLRLDVQEDAHNDAIVPGSSAESEVYRRLTSDDPDQRMPPSDSNKSLSQAEIDLIRRWIDAGAKYESHWAFIPPVRNAPPIVRSQRDWVRNPIDEFVLARLEREGLSPSPTADRHTLLRRVTLDLTGLPPTQTELNEFIGDDSPAAFERVVDRLLDSESYGERMAQLWLDAARYADTMGYQADWERYQWRWRSWVIDAYNRNLPFDQFTIEQLAGDLLPDPSVEQRIATGFNRNHRINDEAGIIPEEYLVEYIVDRVETTAGTWMGMTMGCARCHDHKFDPISQVDFYRFFAFFNGVPEKGKEGRKGYADPYMRVALRGEQEAYESAKSRVAQTEVDLKRLIASLDRLRGRWIVETISKLDTAAEPWTIAQPSKVSADGPADFERLEDDSHRVSGENLDRPTYLIELTPEKQTISGIRLEALTDPSLSEGSLSPGGGNFILTDFTVDWHNGRKQKPRRLKITDARADYQQRGYPVKHAIDAKKQTGWGVDGNVKKEQRTAVFTFATPIQFKLGDQLVVRMAFESTYPQRVIGRFRFSLTDTPTPDFTDTLGIPRDVVDSLRMPSSARSKAQQHKIAEYHGSIAPETQLARDEFNRAQRQLEEFEKEHTTFVMVMREMEEPRETFVLSRGVYNKPGNRVTAGVPDQVLGRLAADAPTNRLGLARWLVSGKHPLTARVIVNRYWAMLLGNGLVDTIEDFGLQGSYPSHPALLDWLATEYPRIGWDTKRLLKLIVMSATYRQASTITPLLRQRDPDNRLLARMSRVRLPAEMIRDQALCASGLMVHEIGGASVKPYQPEGLWKELSFQDKKRSTDFYEQGTGDSLYRRSLYTFWKRSVPPPAMATFDAPSREMCTLRRSRTNTPLQALALMNDTTYVEASRALAERAIVEAGDNLVAQIRFAFRSLLSRDPDAREISLLTKGFEKRRAFFTKNNDAAQQLISQGESSLNPSLDPVELAAMTTCVMTVMNMDETVNRE